MLLEEYKKTKAHTNKSASVEGNYTENGADLLHHKFSGNVIESVVAFFLPGFIILVAKLLCAKV